MQTRRPQKTGVLGVFCVPKVRKVRYGGAFSHGTQLASGWNTRCSEHQMCSMPGGSWWNTSGHVEQHLQRQCPTAGLLYWVGVRSKVAQVSADVERVIWGRGGV